MATLTVEWDARALENFQRATKELGSGKVKSVLAASLNQVGRKMKTAVKRTLVETTGLKYGAVEKDLRMVLASAAHLEFVLTGTGHHHGVISFGARQGAKGVTAKPWNRSQQFPGTFIATAQGGTQVFKNTRGWNAKQGRFNAIEKIWGPSVPREMEREAIEGVFRKMSSELPAAVERKLAQFMP